MKWDVIEKNIKKECKAHHKSSEFTQKYLAYSKELFDNNLPIISSPEHFSLLVGLEHQYVCNMGPMLQVVSIGIFLFPKVTGRLETLMNHYQI